MNMKKIIGLTIILVLFFSSISIAEELDEQDKIIFQAMQLELNRSIKKLKLDKDRPYFISYTINDSESVYLAASLGKLVSENSNCSRSGNVIVKVGNYKYDNSIYQYKRKVYDWEARSIGSLSFPIENDIEAIRHKLWLLTDSAFKEAVNKFTVKRETEELQVKREDIPSYTKEKAVRYYEKSKALEFNQKEWERILKRVTSEFVNHPEIYTSHISLQGRITKEYFVNSEGTRIKTFYSIYELNVEMSSVSNNNVPVSSGCKFYAFSIEELPDEEELKESIKEAIEDIKSKIDDELLEGYLGPVLITAPASGKLFYELLEKNITGNRSYYENDRLILFNRKNRRITDRNIEVVIDSSVKYYNDEPLLNYHLYDDEGVRSRKVTVVENGIFRNYLMSKTPIKGFSKSNGYAQDIRGSISVSPGNVFITTKNPISFKDMKAELIKICKEFDQPYGLIITEIGSAYDYNGIISFTPARAIKIDVSTGEERVVSGLEMVKTNVLTVLDKIIFLGDDEMVYNSYDGTCIAPSMLIEELELKENRDILIKHPIINSPLK